MPATKAVNPESPTPTPTAAEPRRIGSDQVLTIRGREIVRTPSRCPRCGSGNVAWFDLTAQQEAAALSRAYYSSLDTPASNRHATMSQWDTRGSHCSSCSFSVALNARHHPLQRPAPEVKALARRLAALRADPNFANSARLQDQARTLMEKIDRATPIPPPTTFPLGDTVLISYHAADALGIPKAWQLIEERHGLGDFGSLGTLDGPPPTEEDKFCPPLATPRARNAIAIEAVRGLVISRFSVTTARSGNPRDEKIEIVTHLDPARGNASIIIRPELDQISI